MLQNILKIKQRASIMSMPITQALLRVASQAGRNTAVFNAKASVTSTPILIAGAKIAPNLVFTSISNSSKSLEQAKKNYSLKVTLPVGGDTPSFATLYTTKSGKTKLSVTSFDEPNLSNPKNSGIFQSYNFTGADKNIADFRVAFFEPDNKNNLMRAYLEKSNREIELPPNSYIDFSKGISMDKALIISNVVKNGINVREVRTVQKAFEDGGIAFPPKASVPCTLSIRDVCLIKK
jgi:hypothetical protein